ncbi:MAG TPA: hypothetical protein VFE42_17505 [Chloroflexota bacterium]|nr:hypothetical protein [Chloroflexota bacterium]
MNRLSRYELWYGRDEPPGEVQVLHAGGIRAELHGMDLRYVKAGDTEIVRRIYVAVRDHNWRTIPGTRSEFELDAGADRFTVRFAVHHQQRAIDFSWRATITGMPDGTISYRMDGLAGSAFRYNRIGFCVLHPPAATAGRPYRGRTSEGPVEGTLPNLIGPQRIVDGTYYALFPAVSQLIIDAGDGLEVRFDFEGDLFEMEDQRNWTDNSFKTYCTPLALPWPRDARPGQEIRQSVTVSCTGIPAGRREAGGAAAAGTRLALGESLGVGLPPIGLGMASHGRPLTERELNLLKALKLSHLRADLHLSDQGYAQHLDEAARVARALNCPLELALFVTDAAESELETLAGQLLAGIAIARVLVFHEREESTDGRWVRLACERLRAAAPDAPFAGGSNAYFTELNRSRPDITAMDAISYSLNPQVHAFDELSLVETVQAQAETVRSARSFSDGKPIIVSPITLRPRYNANATEPEPDPAPGELPSSVDPRQMSLFGAIWTLGSVKYLAESGAAALTYYETTGWRGVMETAEGSPAGTPFPSRPGMVFPLYHVFADLAACRPGELVACRSGDPLRAEGLAVRLPDGLRVLLANMTGAEQQVSIGPLPPGRAALRVLDEGSAEAALFEPERFRGTATPLEHTGGEIALTLPPYAMAHLHVTG